MRVKVNTNVYYIPERIKEIDSNWDVYYNKKTGNFEIHNKNRVLGRKSIVMYLPFISLDARAITYIHKTIKQNRDIEIEYREMQRHNQKLEENNQKKQADQIQYQTKEVFRHIDHNPSRFI
jgi:hypothetical protein